jgi:hypothetical protein
MLRVTQSILPGQLDPEDKGSGPSKFQELLTNQHGVTAKGLDLAVSRLLQ